MIYYYYWVLWASLAEWQGVSLVSRGTSVQICFGSPLSSKVVVCWHCLVTLSLTINETLKCLLSLPTLMHESFWWWQCSDRYIISLFPHLHTPFPPFSSSLISLVVSVDVKHQVYLLYWLSTTIKKIYKKYVELNTLHISDLQLWLC